MTLLFHQFYHYISTQFYCDFRSQIFTHARWFPPYTTWFQFLLPTWWEFSELATSIFPKWIGIHIILSARKKCPGLRSPNSFRLFLQCICCRKYCKKDTIFPNVMVCEQELFTQWKTNQRRVVFKRSSKGIILVLNKNIQAVLGKEVKDT